MMGPPAGRTADTIPTAGGVPVARLPVSAPAPQPAGAVCAAAAASNHPNVLLQQQQQQQQQACASSSSSPPPPRPAADLVAVTAERGRRRRLKQQRTQNRRLAKLRREGVVLDAGTVCKATVVSTLVPASLRAQASGTARQQHQERRQDAITSTVRAVGADGCGGNEAVGGAVGGPSGIESGRRLKAVPGLGSEHADPTGTQGCCAACRGGGSCCAGAAVCEWIVETTVPHVLDGKPAISYES